MLLIALDALEVFAAVVSLPCNRLARFGVFYPDIGPLHRVLYQISNIKVVKILCRQTCQICTTTENTTDVEV